MHRFQGFEQNEMVSLVQLAVIFGWGLSALADTAPIWYLTHDGDISVTANQESRAYVITEALKS